MNEAFARLGAQFVSFTREPLYLTFIRNLASPQMPSTPEPTFEEALRRLEAIVSELEGELPALDEALIAYEEGVNLAKFCMDRLRTAELRIQELSLE